MSYISGRLCDIGKDRIFLYRDEKETMTRVINTHTHSHICTKPAHKMTICHNDDGSVWFCSVLSGLFSTVSSLHSLPLLLPLVLSLILWVCVCLCNEGDATEEDPEGESKCPTRGRRRWRKEGNFACVIWGNKGWNQARRGAAEESDLEKGGRRRINEGEEGGRGWIVAHVTVNYFQGLITADSQVSV